MKKKVDKIKDFIKGCGDIIYILIFVTGAYIFVMAYIGQIPSIAGYRFLRAVGDSMNPTIKKGECIVIKNTDISDIHIGDVITFYSDDPQIYGYPNTHRVTDIVKNEDGTREYVTKGDANEDEDMYTAKEGKIIGKYQGDILIGKAMTKLFDLLSNRTVYFCVMVLPIVICLIINIFDLIKILVGDDDDED